MPRIGNRAVPQRSGTVAKNETYDIVVLADFTRAGDPVWRIAEETRIHAAKYRTGFVHLSAGGARRPQAINPAADDVVRRGLATPLDPSTDVHTKLLLVADPDCAPLDAPWPAIRATRTVVIVPASAADGKKASQIQLLCQQQFGEATTWTALSEETYWLLQQHVPVESELWQVAVVAAPRRRAQNGFAPPVLGVIVEPDRQSTALEAVLLTECTKQHLTVRSLEHKSAAPARGSRPASWQTLDYREISLGRFLEGVDCLFFYPEPAPRIVPFTAIAKALAAGVPVLLPPTLRRSVGPGPIYVAARDAVAAAVKLPLLAAGTRTFADRKDETRFDPARHLAQLAALSAAPTREKPRPRPRPRSAAQPAAGQAKRATR